MAVNSVGLADRIDVIKPQGAGSLIHVCSDHWSLYAIARSPVGGGDDIHMLPTLSAMLFLFLSSTLWPMSTRTKYLFIVKIITSNIIVNQKGKVTGGKCKVSWRGQNNSSWMRRVSFMDFYFCGRCMYTHFFHFTLFVVKVIQETALIIWFTNGQ